MLEVLRRLIQDVNAADALEEALVLIVAQVRAAMQADVCTIYLHDKPSEKLIFRATEGLNKDKVGQFGLAFDEGLVGWVATREEPLNLDDASAHPQFQWVEGLGEEPFNAFLGAPIVHQRDLLGVLVVQQGDHRRFSEDEEAFNHRVGTAGRLNRSRGARGRDQSEPCLRAECRECRAFRDRCLLGYRHR